jgi:hypothetical protein
LQRVLHVGGKRAFCNAQDGAPAGELGEAGVVGPGGGCEEGGWAGLEGRQLLPHAEGLGLGGGALADESHGEGCHEEL